MTNYVISQWPYVSMPYLLRKIRLTYLNLFVLIHIFTKITYEQLWQLLVLRVWWDNWPLLAPSIGLAHKKVSLSEQDCVFVTSHSCLTLCLLLLEVHLVNEVLVLRNVWSKNERNGLEYWKRKKKTTPQTISFHSAIL